MLSGRSGPVGEGPRQARCGGRLAVEGYILSNGPCKDCPHPARGIPTQRACRALCDKHESCEAWVHNTRDECYLKGGSKLQWRRDTDWGGRTWSARRQSNPELPDALASAHSEEAQYCDIGLDSPVCWRRGQQVRRCFDRAHPSPPQPPPQPSNLPQVKHVGEHKQQVARGSARNVLLVIVDDLRPDLGVYGRTWAHTPHLDKLGAQGTVFSSAHAAVANCGPSRAAVLTGRRPDWNGVIDLNTRVRQHEPDTITLPQHLKDSGWNTAFHGKVFHHGQNDGNRSWSRQHRSDWAYTKYMTSGRSVPVGNHFNLLHERGHDVNPHGANYTDHALASLAINTMRRLNAAPKPWFLAVGFIRPHLPFIAPAPFYDRFLQNRRTTVPVPPRVTAPSGASDLTAKSVKREGLTEIVGNFGYRGSLHWNAKRDSEGSVLAGAYAACVSWVDSQVGRVIRFLDGSAARSRTVVAVIGDHGWKLGHLGGWGKHSLMTQDTHVPLIIRTPRHGPSGSGGRVVHEPVELIDLYPTLVELAGAPAVPPHHKLMGRSLKPALFNTTSWTKSSWAADAFAISQWPYGHDWSNAPPCMGYAVRLPGWTLVQWVHSPMRCTKHRCNGPLRGRDHAEWASIAKLRDPCVDNADLFKTPRTYGVQPEVEPDGHNVISQHPEQAARMRRLLANTMKMPRRAVGLTTSSSGGARAQNGRKNFWNK